MIEYTSKDELDLIINKSASAFKIYKNFSLEIRRNLMFKIAEELDKNRDELIDSANLETNLSKERLSSEFDRTIFQLRSYADACKKGDWLDIRMSKSNGKDIRKMLVPLGPVVVFGSSNFPFAYSTPGGDTACALAAGCTVIIKGHPAHIKTSSRTSEIINKALSSLSLPEGIFQHLHIDNKSTEYLIKHEEIKAVGFTGSLSGGRQLFDWGNERKNPIPVFAEMGSVNPVFILPEKLKNEPAWLVKKLAASITTSVGQFCTNPGLIISIESEELVMFTSLLSSELNLIEPELMLHEGIFKNYNNNRSGALNQNEVQLLTSEKKVEGIRAIPTLVKVNAAEFINNPQLHKEVFGPYSVIIACKNEDEMRQVAESMEGQLTTTLMATEDDLKNNIQLLNILKNICGRFVLNDVPTGVEVCIAMQHGGPYPATTDSRFTAVGSDGIKRFARPLAWQNWPDNFLPEELKEENSLGLNRLRIDND